MKSMSIMIGCIPLLVFSFAAQRFTENGVAWAAALGAALVLVGTAMSRPVFSPGALAGVSLIPLVAVAIAGFVGGQRVDTWLDGWAIPSLMLLIGLTVLAAAPFAPFTARYTRRGTPREYWGSPTFTKINTVLSTVWGVAIISIGLCHLVLALIDHPAGDLAGSRLAGLLLVWVVPIVFILAATRFTAAYPDRVTGYTPQPTRVRDRH